MRHKGIKVIILADLYRNQGKHIAHLLVRAHILRRHLHFAGANTFSIQTIPCQAHAHLSQSMHPENSLEQSNLQPWTCTWECRCLNISVQSIWTDVCIILKLSPILKTRQLCCSTLISLYFSYSRRPCLTLLFRVKLPCVLAPVPYPVARKNKSPQLSYLSVLKQTIDQFLPR